MAKEGLEDRPLTIGALSRATRIPVETLRTWERRYLSPTPIRKPSGHRLYPVGAVEHLRRVARLLERGHRPGELLRMSNKELDTLLALGEEGDAPPSESRSAAAAAAPDRERSLSNMLRAAT
ncbi:MAG TPA: MerR family transcriptional regulator, partial [Vicinamibacterales bacterium]